MNTKDIELYESLANQLKTIEHLTQNAIKNIEDFQLNLETNVLEPEGTEEDDDDFDFGSSDEEITTPPPASERLCQQCLEELGMNDIDTPPKKKNFICEWCVEKRAMAQAQVVNRNTVSEQDIKEAESLETIVIERRFNRKFLAVCWLLGLGLLTTIVYNIFL